MEVHGLSILCIYTISAVQFGVGALNDQRHISRSAEYGAWVSIVSARVSPHILLYIMYSTLQKTDGNIVTAYQQLFGRLVGNILNISLVDGVAK